MCERYSWLVNIKVRYGLTFAQSVANELLSYRIAAAWQDVTLTFT